MAHKLCENSKEAVDRLHTSKRKCLEAKKPSGPARWDPRQRCTRTAGTQGVLRTACMRFSNQNFLPTKHDHLVHGTWLHWSSLPQHREYEVSDSPLGCSVDTRPWEVVNTPDFSTLLDTKTSAKWKMRWHLIQVKKVPLLLHGQLPVMSGPKRNVQFRGQRKQPDHMKGHSFAAWLGNAAPLLSS